MSSGCQKTWVWIYLLSSQTTNLLSYKPAPSWDPPHRTLRGLSELLTLCMVLMGFFMAKGWGGEERGLELELPVQGVTRQRGVM